VWHGAGHLRVYFVSPPYSINSFHQFGIERNGWDEFGVIWRIAVRPASLVVYKRMGFLCGLCNAIER
jgi:hypothetical protein